MRFLTATAFVALLAVPAVLATTSSADARSTIERACMSSDRRAASKPLCSCIQRVADQILTPSDQRQAAKFFKDPQKAQDMRQSDLAHHEEFWKRYKDFGVSAGNICR